MDSRKLVLKETAIVALGQIVCCAVLVGVLALLSKLDRPMLLGVIFGGTLATLNFLFMAVGVMMAADKAEAQNVKGGKSVIQASQLIRTAVLFIVIFALVKSRVCNVFGIVIPLVFTRPILSVGEFFRKSGEPKA